MITRPPVPARLAWRRDGEPLGDGRAAAPPWARIERAFYPPRFRFPQHRHEFYELFLVERGPGVHRVGREAYPVDASDLVFVHADLAHALEATPSRPLVFINLAIRPALSRELESRYDGVWPWRLETPRPVRLDGEGERDFARRLVDLESGHLCVDRLDVELVVLEAMRLWRLARRPRPAVPTLVARAQRLLAEPDGLRHGALVLAQRLGCSREHLNRVVRRHLGMTTLQLVTRHRLDHAARLLRHGDHSIADACRACGLDNLSHFYQIFRRRFGCTPGAFRGGPPVDAV